MDFHDAVSSTSHLATAVWAAFATLVLLRLTRSHGIGRWAIGFLGLSAVLLYTSSALFHGLHYDSVASRRLFQKVDKSAVFLLIAGTYVPVVVYLLRGAWRRWTFAAVVGATVTGIGALWLDPELPHERLIGVYVVLGLSGLLPIRQYAAVVGWHNLKWAAMILAPYSVGAIVEGYQTPVLVPGWLGPHELMHFAVTAGTVVYFAFVARVLIQRPPLADEVIEAVEAVFAPVPEPELTPSLSSSQFVSLGM